MKKNVGTIDRTLRGLVGVALLAAYFLGAVSGTLGYRRARCRYRHARHRGHGLLHAVHVAGYQYLQNKEPGRQDGPGR